MLAPQPTQLLQGICVRSKSLGIKTRLAVWGEIVNVYLAFEGMFCHPTEASIKAETWIRHFRYNKETGAEMRSAMVSGTATENAPVSYWPFFLVPEVFAKVNSSQFPLFYCGKYLTITLGKVNLFYTNCQRFSWWWSYALLACFFPNNRLLSYAIMSSLLHIPLLILCSFLIEIMLAVPRDSILLTTFVYNQSPLKRSLSFAIRDFNSVALFWWILLEMEAFFSRWTSTPAEASVDFYFTRMTW